MHSTLLARIGAVVFGAFAITMTAIQMTVPQPTPPEPIAVQHPERPIDPLRDELVRCQSIGQAGAGDPACLRAWAENRRRFLAPGARPMARLPAAATAE